jgi:hypothetical protein
VANAQGRNCEASKDPMLHNDRQTFNDVIKRGTVASCQPVNSSVARHPPINENRGDVFLWVNVIQERMLGYEFSDRHVPACYNRELAAI